MDPRESFAKQYLENNILKRMQRLQDDVAQLQKLYIASGVPVPEAEYDFQVGNGLGRWIKASLAETLAILGLPSSGGVVAVTGWKEVTDTWAYASASTFTVPTDATLTYQKGDPVRWKQGGGYKYGNIASVTATVVTILINSDHVIANSAVTDVAYARTPTPFGFPEWFNFASTVTPNTGAITTQSSSAQYKCIGRLMHSFINIAITNNGTGAGFIKFTTQAAFVDGIVWGSGRENNVTGNQLQVTSAGGGTAAVFNYNNTYPGGNGYSLLVGVSVKW